MRARVFVSVALLACLAPGPGCVGFSEIDLHTKVPPRPADAEPLRASYVLTLRYFETGDDKRPAWRVFPTGFDDRYPTPFAKVFMDSGYFSEFMPAPPLRKGDDIHVILQWSVETTNPARRIRPTGAQFIDMFLFIAQIGNLLIPDWVEDVCTLKAVVHTKDGRRRTYEIEGGRTEMIWLFAIVASPIFPAFGLAERVRDEMLRRVLVRMIEDGVLPGAKASGTGTNPDK